MKSVDHRFTAVVILSVLFTSCQNNHLSQKELIQRPLANVKLANASMPQSSLSAKEQGKMLNLPSRLNHVQISEPSEQQLKEIHALKSVPSDSYQIARQKEPVVNVLSFSTNARNLNQEIKIAESINFQLSIAVGPSFKIIDGDATDGSARIQISQGNIDTLFHLENILKPTGQLEVIDNLYGVRDTLNNTKGRLFKSERWFYLGSRPVPVPSNWYSADGADFVLSFKPNQVRQFKMVTVKRNQASPFPPGIASIGTQGGTVELPGIARLVIPQGALSQPTVIALKEETSAPLIKGFSLNEERTLDYASSVVKMNPLGLVLQKEAKLFMTVNADRIGNNHSSIAHLFVNPNFINPTTWTSARMSVPNLNNDSWPADIPGLVSTLSYATRLIPGFISPTDGSKMFLLDSDVSGGNFTTQQLPPPTGSRSHFVPILRGNLIPVNDYKQSIVRSSVQYLDTIHDYYKSLFAELGSDATPKPSFRYFNEERTQDWDVIPVFFNVGPEARGKTYNWPLDVGASDISIDLEERPNNLYHEPSLAENLAHELWHAFQYAKLSGVVSGGSIVAQNKQWLYEGPAEYMGAHTVKKFPFRSLDPNLSLNVPPHYQSSINLNQDTMDVPIYDRKDFDLTSTFGYSTSAFFTYLADPVAGLNGLKVLTKLAIYHHNNPYDLPFDTLRAVTERNFDEIFPDFALQTLKKDIYANLNPGLSINNVSVFGGRAFTLNNQASKTLPQEIPGPTFQNWATTYFEVTPDANIPDNQALHLKVIAPYSYPLKIQIITYKNEMVNGVLVKKLNTPINISSNSDFLKILNNVKNEASGIYVAVSNISNSPVDIDVINAGGSPFLKIQLALEPNGPVQPQNPWININPNSISEIGVRAPSISCSNDIRVVNFTYINPNTNQPATPSLPMEAILSTPDFGTREYPVFNIVERERLPGAVGPPSYSAWFNACLYESEFGIHDVAVSTGKRRFIGTLTLKDSNGLSNSVRQEWFATFQ